MIPKTIIRQRLYGPATNLANIDVMIPRDAQVKAIQFVMRELENQKTPKIDFILAVDGFEAMAIRFQKANSVATYSLLRARPNEKNAEVCSIGMLLSGLEPAYDSAIIDAVERTPDDSGKPMPFDPMLFRQLRAETERPLSAAYFFKEGPMQDPSMRFAVRSIAEVFFGMTGVFTPNRPHREHPGIR